MEEGQYFQQMVTAKIGYPQQKKKIHSKQTSQLIKKLIHNGLGHHSDGEGDNLRGIISLLVRNKLDHDIAFCYHGYIHSVAYRQRRRNWLHARLRRTLLGSCFFPSDPTHPQDYTSFHKASVSYNSFQNRALFCHAHSMVQVNHLVFWVAQRSPPLWFITHDRPVKVTTQSPNCAKCSSFLRTQGSLSPRSHESPDADLHDMWVTKSGDQR